MVPAVATRLDSRPLRREVSENVLTRTKVRKVDTTRSSFAERAVRNFWPSGVMAGTFRAPPLTAFESAGSRFFSTRWTGGSHIRR